MKFVWLAPFLKECFCTSTHSFVDKEKVAKEKNKRKIHLCGWTCPWSHVHVSFHHNKHEPAFLTATNWKIQFGTYVFEFYIFPHSTFPKTNATQLRINKYYARDYKKILWYYLDLYTLYSQKLIPVSAVIYECKSESPSTAELSL